MSEQVFQKVSLEDQEKARLANGGKFTMEQLAKWGVHPPIKVGTWQEALAAGTDPSIRPRTRKPKAAPEPQRKPDGTLWMTLDDKKMVEVVSGLLVQYVSPDEMAILAQLMSKEVYKCEDPGLRSFLELIILFPRVQRDGVLKFLETAIEFDKAKAKLNANE
jgi:hypothetical protein